MLIELLLKVRSLSATSQLRKTNKDEYLASDEEGDSIIIGVGKGGCLCFGSRFDRCLAFSPALCG
jgi:hypothetical protein